MTILYTCSLQGNLLGGAKYLYGYGGDILVEETFKDFADTVCSNFDLQYPQCRMRMHYICNYR